MPYGDKGEQRVAQAKHARKKRQQRREFLWSLKDRPCADCGMKYPPYVMQFDHLHDKKFNMASFIGTWRSKALVVEEAKKCDVVCANCHAERTYQRQRVAQVSQPVS